MSYLPIQCARVGQLPENGVGHIGEKRVGQLPEKSGFKVGHFPENSHFCYEFAINWSLRLYPV